MTETITSPVAGIPETGKRVNVIFSNEQFEALQRLAELQNITLSEALRQVVNLSKVIVEAHEDPKTKILLQKGDSIEELKIVSSRL